MGIDRNDYVTFEYVLRNDKGELIEASQVDNPPTYVHGYNQLVSGLEQHMKGKKVGERFSVKVEPRFGYGERDDSLVIAVPRSEIPSDVALHPGQSFEAVNDAGHTIRLRVQEVGDNEVLLDANHPLAGERLNYDITVKAIRPATEDEIMEVTAAVMGTDKGEA